jgi:hypothetical protein
VHLPKKNKQVSKPPDEASCTRADYIGHDGVFQLLYTVMLPNADSYFMHSRIESDIASYLVNSRQSIVISDYELIKLLIINKIIPNS